MALRGRELVTTYLVVGFFAILLAFPFYWMGMPAFKPIGDLLNVENLPFWFHPGPTWDNFQNLFDTNYTRWLPHNAFVRGGVGLLTLLLLLAARVYVAA